LRRQPWERLARLAAQAAAFNTGMNGSQGLLQLDGGATGSTIFSGETRVEKWNCELDQLVAAINFSFTGVWLLVMQEVVHCGAQPSFIWPFTLVAESLSTRQHVFSGAPARLSSYGCTFFMSQMFVAKL
jgi:hypothetical protein